MNKQEKLRTRYLQDPVPIRLGGLAANLGRAGKFSKHEGHREVVYDILQESKWFIEWTAAELEDLERAAELMRLQILLAFWQIQSVDKWDDSDWRSEFGRQAQQWSQRILEFSGLLTS